MIMIHNDRRPYQCGMTGIAGVAAADVVGNFAGRGDTIVATDTGAKHNTVIYPVGSPELSVMTRFTFE